MSLCQSDTKTFGTDFVLALDVRDIIASLSERKENEANETKNFTL